MSEYNYISEILEKYRNGEISKDTAIEAVRLDLDDIKKTKQAQTSQPVSKIKNFVLANVDEMIKNEYTDQHEEIEYITNWMDSVDWKWLDKTVTPQMFKEQLVELIVSVVKNLKSQYEKNPDLSDDSNELYSTASTGGLRVSGYIDEYNNEPYINLECDFSMASWNDSYKLTDVF